MIREFLKKSLFARNVLTLMTGTSIAQAIPVAISPILTRLYTPEDFGILALYMAVSSIFAVIATGRYELAIMLPRNDSDAASILALSVGIAFFISLVTFLIIFFFNTAITELLGNPAISNWLYFVPLTVLITGMYQSLNYWFTRQGRFKHLAYARIAQGGATGVSQLGMGYMLSGASGLVVGTVAGQVVATSILARKLSMDDGFFIRGLRWKRIIGNARKYRKFPQFSTWGALFDNAALQMPVLILTRFFDAYITGLFSFTFRVLNLPMSLLSTALSQVLFKKVVAIHHNSPEDLLYFILKIFFGLLAITIPFLLISIFFGKIIFIFLFGENWAQAGEFAAFLAIAVSIRFAVSPLSCVLAMDHNLKKGFYWQLTYVITITATLVIAATVKIGIRNFIIVFTLHEVVLYCLYLFFILLGARQINSPLRKQQY